MAKKNATVYTVAELAGVSIATVSRTLAGSPKVAPETRQRVIQAIEALGFAPDPSARRLASQRTDTIALVFPDISGPFYSSVIRGVEQEAASQDCNVLIYGTHGKESSGRFLRDLTSKVDGMIILARSIEDAYLLWLQKQGFPFVLLSRPHALIPSDTVSVDNQGGAYLAAQHLLQHGHRNFAILSGPVNSPDNEERLLGYALALEAVGLFVPPERIFSGHFQYDCGRMAVDQLWKQSDLPTALLAANDEMAMGAIASAQQHGRQVPQDLAVIGFDNIQAAEMLHPALTTIQQPMQRLGETAVELLFQRFQNPGDPWRREILPTHLVVRRSCGCEPNEKRHHLSK